MVASEFLLPSGPSGFALLRAVTTTPFGFALGVVGRAGCAVVDGVGTGGDVVDLGLEAGMKTPVSAIRRNRDRVIHLKFARFKSPITAVAKMLEFMRLPRRGDRQYSVAMPP